MHVTKTTNKGAVASGHPKTTEAGIEILKAGGNAYDAAAASFCAAVFAEHSLASLGGGGHLLAHTKEGDSVLYDFFAQTPKGKRSEEELDFYPIYADFGGAIQTFHVGMGAMAVPGGAKGLFQFHSDLGRLPMTEVIKPAVEMARKGIEVNGFSAFALVLLDVIFKAQAESRRVFGSVKDKGELLRKGEVYKNPDLADTLELLAKEGVDVFYRGEIAEQIVRDSQELGGYITADDLAKYEVKKRKPVEVNYRGATFLTNPPPSAGGTLIAFALKFLEQYDFSKIEFGSPKHIGLIASAMEHAAKVRAELFEPNIHKNGIVEVVLTPEQIQSFKPETDRRVNKWGSTTHTSIIDGEGNIATMTNTNGEGCGYVIPGTGTMMNNMLGEEDLNPNGFHKFRPGVRISSMMAPSILTQNGIKVALGSAGSNRIRSAILQTIVNYIDFGKNMEDAVNGPRVHYEKGELHVEPGFNQKSIENIKESFPKVNMFEKLNLYFGGANCTAFNEKTNAFSGAGDVRREGSFDTA